MKIVFLCGCLEPDRDGVGDYTRRLAAESIRQGHFSTVLSLNDKYVSDKFNDIQRSEGTDLSVLRLPAAWAMKVRLGYAKKYIDDFNPDWLSLQFVIFGFHRKGLPLGLGNQLLPLGLGRRWHIMFHELWLGMEMCTPKKHLLWGWAQRQLIKSLISTLNPKIIHTNTILYQQQLAKLGFIAQHLSLFGNIPKVYSTDERLNSIEPFKIGKSINFILFAQIFPDSPVDDFLDDVVMYASKNEVEITLTIIGRCGSEQEVWADKWAATGMAVNILGSQPANNISKALGTASIGISTTPAALIEKSGSVAAMLEHGLPVICVPFRWEPKNFKELKLPSGIMLYKKGNLEAILKGGFDSPAMNDVSGITHKLLSALLKSA